MHKVRMVRMPPRPSEHLLLLLGKVFQSCPTGRSPRLGKPQDTRVSGRVSEFPPNPSYIVLHYGSALNSDASLTTLFYFFKRQI